MAEPFWERAYEEERADIFGPPSAEIVRLADELPAGSRVLDIGCGDGRNARFLADRGFAVDAFDVSAAAVARLPDAVRGWVEDAAGCAFAVDHDLVIAHGMLHLLERDHWRAVIERMKRGTRPGGVNVVAVFTDKLPPPDDLAPFMRGLFREGELRDLYADWEIESFESYVFNDEHPGGVEHTHPLNKIVARTRCSARS